VGSLEPAKLKGSPASGDTIMDAPAEAWNPRPSKMVRNQRPLQRIFCNTRCQVKLGNKISRPTQLHAKQKNQGSERTTARFVGSVVIVQSLQLLPKHEPLRLTDTLSGGEEHRTL